MSKLIFEQIDFKTSKYLPWIVALLKPTTDGDTKFKKTSFPKKRIGNNRVILELFSCW